MAGMQGAIANRVVNTNDQNLYGNNGQGSAEQLQSSQNVFGSSQNVNDAIARAEQIKTNRANDKLDTSAQDGWLGQLYTARNNFAQQSQQQQAQQQASLYDPKMFDNPEQMNALNGAMQGSRNSFVANAQAQLDATRSQAISQLSKAYEDAVANGHISIRDAETQFNNQKAQIEQQHYADSERMGLTAQDRGIQNSQQMLGLQMTSDANSAKLINTNVSDRDKRIADIQDRMNALSKQKDLDIANANTQYNSGLLQATNQADMNMSNQQFQLGMEQWKQQQAYLQQLGMLKAQDFYQGKQQDKQNAFAHGENQANQQFDLTKLGVGNQYQLGQMDAQHGYKVDEMKLNNQFDLEKLAQQFANQRSLQAQSLSAQAGMNNAKIAAGQKAQEDAIRAEEAKYNTAMQRELNKFDANTPEGQIRQAQLKDQRDQTMLGYKAKLQAEAEAKSALSGPDVAPTAPTASLNYFSALGGLLGGGAYNSDGEMDFSKYYSVDPSSQSDYNKQMQAYQNKLNYLNN